MMQTATLYDYHDDEPLHPLWLGILILIFVILTLGILCCLRIRFASQLRTLFNRKKPRKNQDDDNLRNNGRKVSMMDAYHWSSVEAYSEKPSTRCSVIIPNIYVTDSHDNVSIAQIAHDDGKPDNEFYLKVDMNQHQMSSLPSVHNIPSPEIARKFYASIRSTTDTRNSISYESYESDSFISNSNPTAISAERCRNKKESNNKLTRKPCFFHTIPYTDGLALDT